MTSKWVRRVMQQRDHSVEWRFISLRLINAEVDYEASCDGAPVPFKSSIFPASNSMSA